MQAQSKRKTNKNTFRDFLVKKFTHFKMHQQIESAEKIFISRLMDSKPVRSVLKNEDIALFDKLVRDIRPTAFQSFSRNYVGLYIEFQKFLYAMRKEILRRYNLEEESFELKKQKRVVSPGAEAYEYTGNNKLDISENRKVHTFIYG
jgi:hypothetical protein